MHFAVIDTETNWYDEVMSLGLVISNEQFTPVVKCYYIFTPEYKVGGMFSKTLNNIDSPNVNKYFDSRPNILQNIRKVFAAYNVQQVFAYNARFDWSHLPELNSFKWYDIMRIARYKKYNKFIPEDADCNEISGRMKRGYGVEPIYRMVTGNTNYREKHNGYHDAEDELIIMQKLGVPFEVYTNCQIN